MLGEGMNTGRCLCGVNRRTGGDVAEIASWWRGTNDVDADMVETTVGRAERLERRLRMTRRFRTLAVEALKCSMADNSVHAWPDKYRCDETLRSANARVANVVKLVQNLTPKSAGKERTRLTAGDFAHDAV